MLHKFLETVWWMNKGSEFEAYLMNLQRSGLPGVPTMDEAWQDYIKTFDLPMTPY